jgi:hypothetical protein
VLNELFSQVLPTTIGIERPNPRIPLRFDNGLVAAVCTELTAFAAQKVDHRLSCRIVGVRDHIASSTERLDGGRTPQIRMDFLSVGCGAFALPDFANGLAFSFSMGATLAPLGFRTRQVQLYARNETLLDKTLGGFWGNMAHTTMQLGNGESFSS